MNIEFIKWLVNYAYNFEYEIEYNNLDQQQYICYACGEQFEIDLWEIEEYEHYPLLLQRAIEGINREEYGWYVDQDHSKIFVQPFQTIIEGICFRFDKDPDQAKEAALKYIWEQEE